MRVSRTKWGSRELTPKEIAQCLDAPLLWVVSNPIVLAFYVERAGRQALHQVLSSEWWDWSMGSSLLFWHWDVDTQLVAARNGMVIVVKGELLTKMRRTRWPTPEKAAQLGPKIDTVRVRTYIYSPERRQTLLISSTSGKATKIYAPSITGLPRVSMMHSGLQASFS